MPLYNYHCESCKYTFEDIAKISEADDPKECPMCGEMAKKIFSPCKTFILKGWGWSFDGYDISKEKKTKEVFNKDGTLKSQEGDKQDYDTPLTIDMGKKKTPVKKTKSGRKRIDVK